MQAEQIVNRFRVVALERLARLEAAWNAAVLDPANAEAAAEMHRELHTLKGDARMVGFTDVDVVCHKLEDMLEVARAKAYAVSDDFELLVIMAVQLAAMLIRKRVGAAFGGIDLPGFIRQVDAILAETRAADADVHPRIPRTTTATTSPLRIDDHGAALAPAARAQLATTALELFLEDAAQTSRTQRVRRGWHALRDLLALPTAVPLAPLLEKHGAGVRDLARELGKDVDVAYAIGPDLRTEPAVCAALDVAVLHLVRNAIDHGIEAPGARAATRKPRRGTITVSAALADDRLRLAIADDGAGIDFAAVRARATALGLVAPGSAELSEAALAGVLFQPGFSTRAVATDISGRGIGLDAVAAAIAAAGGTIAVASQAGRGTTWTIDLPAPQRRLAAAGFTIPGSAVRFAVASPWTVHVVEDPRRDVVLDLGELFGLAATGDAAGPAVTLRIANAAMAIHVRAAWPPTSVTVRRLLVTPPDATAEIVTIDGFEGLLVRPDRLIQGTGRIAILDDSEICRDLVTATLAPFGVEVVGIDRPDALIARLALAAPVDLLLLDLSFARLDLAELVARVRAAIPDLAIYLHADRPAAELSRLVALAHADGALPKSADPDALVGRISRVLRARRAG